VALSKLRRYDVQATYSIALSLVALAPFGAAAVLLARNFDREGRVFAYGEGSPYLPVLLVLVGVSFLISAGGSLLGLSSAGQRRNDKNQRSWIGFLFGGLLATLSIIMGLAFILMRFQIPRGA
jgi:hypothetical protein